MAFDDHIRVALDRALADVRAPLESALHALAGLAGAIVHTGTMVLRPAADTGASNPRLAALDLLTRHASRVLEAMTIRHIAGLSRPSAAPRRLADGDHPSPGSIW